MSDFEPSPVIEGEVIRTVPPGEKVDPSKIITVNLPKEPSEVAEPPQPKRPLLSRLRRVLGLDKSSTVQQPIGPQKEEQPRKAVEFNPQVTEALKRTHQAMGKAESISGSAEAAMNERIERKRQEIKNPNIVENLVAEENAIRARAQAQTELNLMKRQLQGKKA